MAGNFSEAQRNEIATIIAQAMTLINQNQPAQPARATTEAKPDFRPRDIRYFEPDPLAIPVEAKDGYNVYHNVFSFTNRLRVKESIIDAAFLRQNIESYLLGTADDWYSNQISYISCISLRNNPNSVKE